MKPLRLGLIGTGIAAERLYLPRLQKLRGHLRLEACANRTRSKAVAFAKLAKVPLVFDTAEALLACPDLDAVLISLPIELQPAMVLKALRAGKHVLSEKPVAGSLAQGRALLKQAAPFQHRGLRWMVGENFRFWPQGLQLRTWLEQGRLGDVRLVEVRQLGLTDERVPYFHTAWRTRPKFVGGFVTDAGVHLAHVVRSCFGLPLEIRRLTAQYNPMLRPLDTVVAALRFPGGILGSWTSCYAAADSGPILTVRGSKANAVFTWHDSQLQAHGSKPLMGAAGGNGMSRQFKHFAEAVRGGTEFEVNPAETLADLAFMQGLVQGKALRP
ncbi:MAG TPA: Gfo/Idh/MocA family oxidoreductase [bacterium]|nr:Gfo/Idh/MocA family oxidoreductase [bacterium]